MVFNIFRMIPGSNNKPEQTDEFLSLPIKGLPEKIKEYVSEIETQRTNDWCKCDWIVHPDDNEIDPDCCAKCGHPVSEHSASVIFVDPDTLEAINYTSACVHQGAVDCLCRTYTQPNRRRLRRGDQHPFCPIHTKEGFLLTFFEWTFRDSR